MLRFSFLKLVAISEPKCELKTRTNATFLENCWRTSYNRLRDQRPGLETTTQASAYFPEKRSVRLAYSSTRCLSCSMGSMPVSVHDTFHEMAPFPSVFRQSVQSTNILVAPVQYVVRPPSFRSTSFVFAIHYAKNSLL